MDGHEDSKAGADMETLVLDGLRTMHNAIAVVVGTVSLMISRLGI